MGMDLTTPLDPQDLLQRYAHASPEPRLREARIGPYLICATVWISSVVLVGGPGSLLGLLLIPAGLAAAVGAAELLARVFHQHAHSAWLEAGATVNWVKVHERVVTELKASIQRSRTALLAPNSKMAAHRLQLEQGADEANRSVTFWRDAVEGEPDSAANKAQLDTAVELERKLRDAVQRLDERKERMTAFLNQCEVKADALEFSRRKLEESNKLASLADRTPNVIADAEAALDRLGREFLDDAIHAFTALGGLERFHLTEVAGDLPLASIEDVADEIVRSSQREEEVFEELARELGQSDESPPADEDE